MSEKVIVGIWDLKEVLDNVKFRVSCVNLDWKWDIKSLYEPDEDRAGQQGPFKHLGWAVRTSFTRPDTNTGVVARGFGRWEIVERGATESAAAKTCWVLAEMIVKHELMEAFEYKGVKVFNPHHTMEELSLPHQHKQLQELNDRIRKEADEKRCT
jgi:hypothetical protein